MNLDTGTVTAIPDAAHLTVDGVGGRSGLSVSVPSSLAGAAMVGSMVNVLCDGDVNLLIGVTSGAWIGTVTLFWGTVAQIPAGHLILDGSTFSAAAYPFLYAHLGTTTLPNQQDKVPMGASGTKAVKSTGGSSTISTANLPGHTHTLGGHTHTVSNIGIGSVRNGTGASASVYYPSGASSSTSGPSTDSGSTGSGTAYWPPYAAYYFLIKAA